MRAKLTKNCHFYAEMIKFGLILTHLKLFREQIGGKIILSFFLGGWMPHVPYGPVSPLQARVAYSCPNQICDLPPRGELEDFWSFLPEVRDSSNRGVANLTVPGGQEFHFPQAFRPVIFLIFHPFFFFFFFKFSLRGTTYHFWAFLFCNITS